MLLLLVSNTMYKWVQLDEDRNKYAPQSEAILKAAEAELIYLGDCSDVYCRGNCDTDISVSENLQRFMPNKRFAALSENGYSPEIYLKLIQLVADHSETGPKTLIVTVNLLAFADQTMNDPFYIPTIKKQLLLCEPWPSLVNRARLTFDMIGWPTHAELNEMTQEAQQHILIQLDGQDSTVYDWLQATKEDSLTTSYIQDYAFRFKAPQNQRLKAYQDIVNIAHQEGWKVIFHVVPINLKGLQASVPPALIDLTLENRKHLLDQLSLFDAKVIDNSLILDQSDFLGRFSNTHYRTEAKWRVSQNLFRKLGVSD